MNCQQQRASPGNDIKSHEVIRAVPAVGSAGAETKRVPSAENQELSKIPSEYIAMYESLTDSNSAVLISAVLVPFSF